MDHSKLALEFNDRTMRTETIFHLATMCNLENFPDSLKDAFYDDFSEVWAAIGIAPPSASDEYDYEPDVILEHLEGHKKLGFLIKAATPVPDFNKDLSYSCSWGFFTTEWIYAETLDEAFDKALAWRESYIDRKRAQFLAA